MNARLQVEHPITEIRFGCDLVAEQIKIARGEKITAPGAPRGHAIECRINAEDAAAGFRPATGTVLELRVPAGPGVRFDSHLTRGTIVGAFYDGLLGKLITHGADREQARTRMVGALDELAILGVTNTAGFLRDVIASEAFAACGFIDAIYRGKFSRLARLRTRIATDAALIAAALTSAGALGASLGYVAGSANASAAAPERSPWTALRGFELWRRS